MLPYTTAVHYWAQNSRADSVVSVAGFQGS